MLQVALKEWHIVWSLMMRGECCVLFRKGGIHEDRGPGRFDMRYDRFACWPSWAHQKPESIREPWREQVQITDEPEVMTLQAMAEVAGIWEAEAYESLAGIQDLHPWTDDYVKMRWNYRSEQPLYVVLLRVMKLAEPQQVPNRVVYGGCKSWVELGDEDAIDEGEPMAVIRDDQLQRTARRIAQTLQT